MKIDIVCFSDIFWDFLWQRHQNILTRFPSSWKILFVEPTSILNLLREPNRLFLRREKNIMIISLPSIPLIDKVRELRFINDRTVLLWIKIIFKLINFKNPILLFYEPRYSSLIGRLDEELVIYDCIDDRLGFLEVPKWMSYYINILINKSNFIMVTSDKLCQNIRNKRTNNVYLIGNGVDLDHFKMATKDIAIPIDIKYVKKPIIGYIGVIDHWFDFELVTAISIAYPECSIILIGPSNKAIQKKLEKLESLGNIYVLGRKSYLELPNYLKAIDIAIIPFEVNSLTECVNPVKLYEYMASNKIIISSKLPELLKYDNCIYIANDLNEFVKLIKIALDNSGKEKKLGCMAKISEENSWDIKAKEIISLIQQFSYK
jgi:glycosyltransferase involved in cell wall biosynthesis